MGRSLLAVAVLILSLLPGAVSAQTSSADYTEPYQRRALDIYRDIIGMRTSAGHGQVPAMAAYLADVFRSGGFPAEDVHVFHHVSDDGEAIEVYELVAL